MQNDERKGCGNRDVGRGDLTPPPYNEIGFVYRNISENRKMPVHRRADRVVRPYNKMRLSTQISAQRTLYVYRAAG